MYMCAYKREIYIYTSDIHQYLYIYTDWNNQVNKSREYRYIYKTSEVHKTV